MSQWNHPMCDGCWTDRMGDREPVRVAESEIQTCCFCGMATRSGIFVREDPTVPVYHQPHPDPDA